MEYQCDWTYARSPRCTVTLDAPFARDGSMTRNQYLFMYGKTFLDAGWTIGTGSHRGKAYCAIHRDTLLLQEMRMPRQKVPRAPRPAAAAPPTAPMDRTNVGQGMVRPFISADQLAERAARKHVSP
jgi:hypothetical protein